MSQDRNNDIFDEFEFMYRHKRALQQQQEKERLRQQQEEKEAAEAAAKAAEAALLSAEQEKKAKKKKTAPADKKKKPETKVQEKQPEKKEKKKKEEKSDAQKHAKIHPKYGKPYKKDTDKERRRIKTDRRKEIEKKYEKEHEAAEKERKNRAEIKAAAKIIASRTLLYIVTALVAAILLSFLIYGVARLAVGWHKDVSHKKVLYQVGSAQTATRVAYDSLIKDDVVYVCGDDIVVLCGFTVTGTKDQIKYISPDKGNDTVLFNVGTNSASVNKNDVRLQAKTYYDDNGRLYIPISFFSSYSTGIVCEYKPETENEGAQIKVYKRILNEYDYKISGVPAQYEAISFKLKEAVVLAPLDENVLQDEIPEATYKVDITDYYDSINPHNLYAYISVINEDHRAVSTMYYDDLTQIVIQSPSVKEPLMLRRDAARALEAMFLEVRGVEGYERFNVYSAYRTFEEAEGKDPSLDENLLGLSVDAYFGDKDSSYADTNTYKWFLNNAYKYGFIIRYPKNKTSVTGVGFRPWTLRYVGRYAATKIHDEGLCLEEFIEKYNLERVLQIKKGE